MLWTVEFDFSHTATSQWPLTPTHNLEYISTDERHQILPAQIVVSQVNDDSLSHTPCHQPHPSPSITSFPSSRPVCPGGRGSPGDPPVMPDCMSCNTGKRAGVTISLCSRRCCCAGRNNSHKPAISVRYTPAAHLQTARRNVFDFRPSGEFDKYSWHIFI